MILSSFCGHVCLETEQLHVKLEKVGRNTKQNQASFVV